MKFRVYISASTQKDNIGIADYGNEQDRMQYLAERVSYWLKTQAGVFEIFRNAPGMTLRQTTDDCNSLACNIFVDLHSNAGAAEVDGTEAYYCEGSHMGQKLAEALYKYTAPLSPGTDQGVFPDTRLYTRGLYVLRNTVPPAALLECFYHTNAPEVAHYLKHIEDYAKGVAQGICEYFNVVWSQSVCPNCTIDILVEDLQAAGIITDTKYWSSVLKGHQIANPQYLQVALSNALKQAK